MPGGPDSGQVFVVLNCISPMPARKMLAAVGTRGWTGWKQWLLPGAGGGKGTQGLVAGMDGLSDLLWGVSSAAPIPHGMLVGVGWAEGVWAVC